MDEPVKRGRGRPKGSKNIPKDPVITKANRKRNVAPKSLRELKPRKICAACNRELVLDNYYRSKNPMYRDGYSPFCKDCIAEKCIDENGVMSVENLKMVLRMLDRPYINMALESAMEEYKRLVSPVRSDEKAIVGRYFRIIALPQWCEFDWNEGIVFEEQHRDLSEKSALDIVTKQRAVAMTEYDKPVMLEKDDLEDVEITSDVIQKFGEGYTTREYAAMIKKYDFLSQSYSDYSSLHVEALTTYVRHKVKEEFATAVGDVENAEKWGALAAKAADKAKINPSQIKEEDTAIGFSWSEFNAAIERAANIVTVLPKFKYMPNDSVDFCIWVYINYVRGIQGLEPVEYAEVYKFYDDSVHEYLQQYGDPFHLFEGDPTLANREKVKRFIEVPRTSLAAFDNPDL